MTQPRSKTRSRKMPIFKNSVVQTAVLFSGLICATANAQESEIGKEFVRVAACAKAKVVSGDTCSNVKVEFDFSGCDSALGKTNTSRVVCVSNSIRARASLGGFRAEANFKKAEDGWGAVEWSSSGEVKSYSKAATGAPVAAPAIAIKSQPAVSETVVSEQTAGTSERAPSGADSNLQFSGFIDMRFTGYRSADATVNEKTRSGFLQEDGALYANYSKGALSALIDLPFSRNGGSTNADFSFAKSKAQAVAKYAFNENLSFSLGQFDTLYGVELNDSKDRVFGNTGLAYSQALPVVHAGAYVAYTDKGFTARLMAANPSDRQNFGSDATDASTEYGVTFGYANEMLRAQAGYLTRAMTDLAGGSANRSLVDLLAGGTFGAFDIDLQYSIVSNPQKNRLTDAATDVEDPGTALFALATYKVLDNLKVGARFEKIEKDPGAAGYPEATTFGAAVHYGIQDGITLRAEWNDTNVDRKSATAVYSESRWDIGALIVF